MRISVITPSFNQARFLEKTILSVLNQNYPNLEYIIIDGGSTDDSLDLIKKYKKHLAYWVSEPDHGQSHAINKGLQKCSGDYIGWLNSDDYFEPNILPMVVEAFNDINVGTVCGKIRIVNENDSALSIRYSSPITFDSLLNGDAQINQPGSFHRKTLFDKLGGVDENLNYAMDYELWLRFGIHSGFRQLNAVVANHTFHLKSKTCSAFSMFLPEIYSIRKKYNGKCLSKKNFSIWRCRVGLLRKALVEKILFKRYSNG